MAGMVPSSRLILITMRKAKIVCTIGPASQEPAVLERLIDAGMNVARLNFSHGTQASHGAAIQAIRAAADRRGAAVAVLQDLQGPRIRIATVSEGGVELAEGQMVRLVGGQLRSGGQLGARATAAGSMPELPVTYPHLTRDVRPGARILIDDGRVELSAMTVANGAVECRVKRGGRVTTHKGLNLPGTTISAPTLTDKDRDDIRFGVGQGVEYLALSFVRGPADIHAARRFVQDCGGDQPIIAKVERAEAVESLDAILEAADGVMIARGDLGVEMGPEAVPLLQKRMIAAANRRRRVIITATQMLESMITESVPTRAEASDVANAVFDGTDAVMLSGETASGRFPVEAVRVMDRIVRAAEAEPTVQASPPARPSPQGSIAEAMCAAAASASATTEAAVLAVLTESGTTARLLSKQRPGAPIVAFTPHEGIRRRMALFWGVEPLVMARVDDSDRQLVEVERSLKTNRLVKTGDRMVLLAGTVAGRPGGTNVMKLHEVE
ncbi:Pyruvate kinase [Nitrospira moscoviensis]|uniref:Pyruvate kinase n=2 Tax=Nitrospira moscoviensis TaxID=42253 RepID=A0A0K2GJ54_NITMO|nr:Pyruvate kinase [Nitrospira moscoviensis]